MLWVVIAMNVKLVLLDSEPRERERERFEERKVSGEVEEDQKL